MKKNSYGRISPHLLYFLALNRTLLFIFRAILLYPIGYASKWEFFFC